MSAVSAPTPTTLTASGGLAGDLRLLLNLIAEQAKQCRVTAQSGLMGGWWRA